MAAPDPDAPLDRLYQLPLEEFTQARNALAKELKRPEIKALDKPNIAAWAVNQLYWTERSTYDALIAAAEALRGAHRKLLSGQPSDIRDVERAHRDAIRQATDKVKSLLSRGGHAAGDATLSAVQETLESLPSADQPGRLTRPLKPLGFAALAGLDVRPQSTGSRPQPTGEAATAPRALRLVKSEPEEQHARAEAKRRDQEDRERKERQRQAEKELKAAEAAMLRAEEAVKKAERALAQRRAERDEAVSEYQRARLRARE